jgi:ESS family glutamate:Na+ symporter
MSAWDLQMTLGDALLDVSWFGALLVVATWLRRYVRWFQDLLLPNNLIAGVIGLVIGMNGFGWIDLPTERLGAYVYHLLALLFIGLSLRKPDKSSATAPVKFGLIFISSYLVQGLIGMTLAFALIYTIMPDLFPGIGLLMPLAFGMNPGIAYTIGHHWEGYGFESGGVVGLTFAAIGFFVAYTVGIAFVRQGIKAGKAAFITSDQVMDEDLRTGIIHSKDKPSGGHLTTSPEAIESLSLHIGLIGFVYILTWLVMKGLSAVLVMIGGEAEINTLWSFHFIIAAIVAMVSRRVIDATGAASVVDDTTMTRLSNVFMDVMVVASVAAISFAVISHYWIPILLLSVFVTIGTWWTIRHLTREGFQDFELERFVSIFGNMTGTMQSAMVLLRVLDAKLKSPVSHDLVYGSGLALALGFPLLILINAPVNHFENLTVGFAAITVALAAYLVLVWLALRWMGKRS